MKNTVKNIVILLIFMLSANSAFAISVNKIDKLIKKSKINETSTIAVSIRNAKTNEVVYEQNQNKLLHPASTLKVFTAYEALNVLGEDYSFKTAFYEDGESNLYIKLGADPLLTSSQLKNAFSELKAAGKTKFKNLYFDDSIADKKEFAPGWMWDDEMNPYTPKVSSYNLDENVLKVTMSNLNDNYLSATVKSTYPTAVISYIKNGAKNDYIEINRYNWNNPEVVEIYGNVVSPVPLKIPLSSMRRYFIHNVEQCLDDSKIKIEGTLYSSKLVPDKAKLLTEISNPVSSVMEGILHNSDNLKAETIFKLAGGKNYASTGSEELAVETFKEFYNKMGIRTDGIVLRDGCGVSRKNLFSADWMTSALNKLYERKDFKFFMDKMAQPGDGTLSKRLFDLRGEAWMKTGSLTAVSGVTGFVNSKDGNVYSFALLTQNFIQDQREIKNFEDEIIKLIYGK